MSAGQWARLVIGVVLVAIALVLAATPFTVSGATMEFDSDFNFEGIGSYEAECGSLVSPRSADLGAEHCPRTSRWIWSVGVGVVGIVLAISAKPHTNGGGQLVSPRVLETRSAEPDRSDTAAIRPAARRSRRESARARWTVLIGLVAVAILAGLASLVRSTEPPAQPLPNDERGSETYGAVGSPEYQLAARDWNNTSSDPMTPDNPIIRDYADVLNNISFACKGPRSGNADTAIAVQDEILSSTGEWVTTLEILQELEASISRRRALGADRGLCAYHWNQLRESK